MHTLVLNLKKVEPALTALCNSRFEVSIHPFRTVYGETPVDAAFKFGMEGVIKELDEDHLLPRGDDPEQPDIVSVRHL